MIPFQTLTVTRWPSREKSANFSRVSPEMAARFSTVRRLYHQSPRRVLWPGRVLLFACWWRMIGLPKRQNAQSGACWREGRVEQPWDFEIRIWSSSPSAKGLGTSSADMAAGLVAVARYLSLDVTEAELFSIMCAVERSDFLFRPGALVCANPLSAEFSIKGPIPRLWLVGWDSEPKRRIATEAVAHLDVRRSRYAPEYADLAGHCNSGETDALLYAVTRSAEINQELLPKPCFRWACKIAKQFDAALLVAHSGTFMAFAVPRDEGDLDRLERLQGMLRARDFDPIVFQTGSLADNAIRCADG